MSAAPQRAPVEVSTQHSPPPRRPFLADRLSAGFQRFFEIESSSAMLLLGMAVLALLWANSPWAASYTSLWQTSVGFSVGNFDLSLPLEAWVNDGLMAIFFFVVGMEIKREFVDGELSTLNRALLPLIAALGGMVVPALIYTGFHLGGPAMRGWGIPMATDIAFAVAALSVLGQRVPGGLRIFLLALAIADDLGAVAVIAVFYTDTIHVGSLGLAGGGLAFMVLMNQAGVRAIGYYLIVGLFVWFEMHHSGVHATVAGVLLGFITPARYVRDHDDETLIERGTHALAHLRELLLGRSGNSEEAVDPSGHHRHSALRQLEEVGRQTLSPLDFLINRLEFWVAFAIMPIFALANAGVILDATTLGDPMAIRVGLAVGLGLLLGKPLGIALFSYVAVRSGIAVLPRGVNWGMVLATGVLAGIGFTVALFVTNLAFDDPTFTAGAKIGILIGSALATMFGVMILARALPSHGPQSTQN